jgi:N-acetylneuraminate synthase
VPQTVLLGDRCVGLSQPVYIVAEIGLNHNGQVDLARRLIDTARIANCDAVKFQKRTVELCVPEDQRDVRRDTPWGVLTYLEYRKRLEFDLDAYRQIDQHCRLQGMAWFASVWDRSSIDFLEGFAPIAYKVPSALITDDELLRAVRDTGRPLFVSTGMSTIEEIRHAVGILGTDNLILMHTTSSYPCRADELNLRMLFTLREEFDCPVGYSGHEVGLQATYAAVAIGACVVERHVTLDRAMWGSDQAASIEPWGLMRLVRDVRVIEQAMGDGTKRVYPSELAARTRLRGTRAGPE